MPSQRGKIAVITGANTGIGYYTALALASHGAHVVLACRNKERGEKAVDEMNAVLAEVSADVRGSVELMLLDLDCLKNVRDFAEELRRKFDRLDLLINNGGATMSLEPLTSDGFETHFGVNHLAHFHLTALLFNLIKASPAARVVNVSSVAHRGMKIDFETIQKGAGPVWMRYGQSKLANLLFTYDLGRRLDEANITNVMSVAAHPGVSRTEGMDKTIEYIPPFSPWSSQIVDIVDSNSTTFSRRTVNLVCCYCRGRQEQGILRSGSIRWTIWPSSTGGFGCYESLGRARSKAVGF